MPELATQSLEVTRLTKTDATVPKSSDTVEAKLAHWAKLSQSDKVSAAKASLEKTQSSIGDTLKRMDNQHNSAEVLLAEMRDTLKRWDDAKENFGKALNAAARRIAEGMMQETNPGPSGPPAGATAHGLHSPWESERWADPKCVLRTDEIARSDMQSKMSASEYHDSPEVLAAKVKVLAAMLRRARHAALYTGAGISTAAGVSDYASKAGSKVKPTKMLSGTPFDAGDATNAEPTYAHRCLTAAHAAGLLAGGWVQQNHDGLPQKAGLPQEAINEIHGAWFDPSNPVVPMAGSLRIDLVQRLRETTELADLVLAIGTSLSGVSADQIVSRVASRAISERFMQKELQTGGGAGGGGAAASTDDKHDEKAATADAAASARPTLGAVIINLQQTRLDDVCSLRIFAKIDDVLAALAAELRLDIEPITLPKAAMLKAGSGGAKKADVWCDLPYDPKYGDLTDEQLRAAASTTTLDLSCGRTVKLAHGNPGLATEGKRGVVGPKTAQGHYTIEWDDGTRAKLGVWMLEAARRGDLAKLPLLNWSDEQEAEERAAAPRQRAVKFSS